MRRAALIILILSGCQPAFAKPYGGFSLGRFNGTPDLASSFIGGAEGGFEFNGISLSLQSFYMNQEMRDGQDPKGSVTLIPISIGMDGRIRAKSGLSANLGASVGYVLSDFQLSKEYERRNELSNVERLEVDIKNDVCFQIRGGLEKRLTPRTSLGFEVSYFLYDTELQMARVRKDGLYRYPWVSPIGFSSIIGKAVLRFR